MARSSRGLTAAFVSNVVEPGRYPDRVNGLNLQVSRAPDGGIRKSWTVRYSFGRQREMGIGKPDTYPLDAARKRAREIMQKVDAGIDPIAERDALRRASVDIPTFKAAAIRYIEENKHTWRNEKHLAQWGATLATYAYPRIGNKPVTEITTADIVGILAPIRKTKAETASRVRQRIEAVIGAEFARLEVDKLNPAQWKGHLARQWPRDKSRKVRHRPALPYADLPEFMAELRQREGYSPACLEFQILTATRPGEASGARWSEMDLDTAGTWTIPASRMKSGVEHVVPLPPQVLKLLRELPRMSGKYVFPGVRGKPITTAAPLKVLKDLRPGLTAHGFRSTFRDWAGDSGYERETCEFALAHVLKGKTEAAYRRGRAFDLRAKLMLDWAHYADAQAKKEPKARG